MLASNRAFLRRGAKGFLVAAASFTVIGTFTALWPNPLFVRMSPSGAWEIIFLGAQSVLLGLYIAVRRPACSVKLTTTGGILNFLGVACPVCNKILLFFFGWNTLMTYYEPTRLYVAAAGAILTSFAVVYEWSRRRPVSAWPMAERPTQQLD